MVLCLPLVWFWATQATELLTVNHSAESYVHVDALLFKK